jgi:hypothetical protein
MAKFELKFQDAEFDFINIQCEKLLNVDLIYIKLGHSNSYTQIKLDKSTAIKFAKTLRTEINKITEEEGGDGNR